jgi:hypothetical protein
MARRATKQDKLDLTRLFTQELEINDLTYIVKKLNAEDLIQIQSTIKDNQPTMDYFISLVYFSVIDEDNKPFFTKEEIHNLNADAFNKFLTAIVELNGLTQEAINKSRKQIKN